MSICTLSDAYGIWIEEMSIANPDSYNEGYNITLYDDGDVGR